MKRAPRIGVMGPVDADKDIYEKAYKTGRLAAERGGIIVCGGRGGAMEAVSRGASEAGGVVVGILPGESESEANPYVTIPIVTGMSHARNAINIWTSQVVIAIGGSFGTLSEIALALKCGRPVVALGSWRLDKIGCDDPLFHIVETPEQAVDLAFRLLKGGQG
jgi:uncharacterized protein (TIGR00725 family)